jgi:two-component system cell cycle response regulator
MKFDQTSLLKVLIADDDPISRRILEKNIKNWGYEVIIVNNGQDAWKVLQKKEIRMAIFDWMMPKINGVQLCQKVRLQKKDKYTYVILLTSRDQQEDIVQGLSSGADDYIVKPFNTLELEARLQTGKRIIDLQNQLIQSKKQLETLATQDSLTKLLNRAAIIKNLEEELNRSSREKNPVGTILVDIDYFKNINDTHGHHVGDEVLIEVASRLKKHIRSYDKIGRYGGDELLIVLPNCTLSLVKEVAERLRKVVSKKKIKTEIGLITVTLSLGGVSSEDQSVVSAEGLIKTSDRALYQAKRNGRNSVVINKHSQTLKEGRK